MKLRYICVSNESSNPVLCPSGTARKGFSRVGVVRRLGANCRRRVLAMSLLSGISLGAAANDWDTEKDPVAVSQLSTTGWEFSAPVAVEDVERRSLDELKKTNGHAPRVPFGGRNAAWEQFKASILPGNVVVYFRSPSDTWDGVYGRAGYALIRNGIVVDAILTLLE